MDATNATSAIEYASSHAGSLRTQNAHWRKCNQFNFSSSICIRLRTHMKTHSGEKSNKCNQCDYASSHAHFVAKQTLPTWLCNMHPQRANMKSKLVKTFPNDFQIQLKDRLSGTIINQMLVRVFNNEDINIFIALLLWEWGFLLGDLVKFLYGPCPINTIIEVSWMNNSWFDNWSSDHLMILLFCQ